jgi:hypothetical protein
MVAVKVTERVIADLREVDGIQISRGRICQAKRTIMGKVLRWECA